MPNVEDTSVGIPSNLTGVTPPGYSPAYGGAPLIPDPIASMWQAIGGDTAGFPSLSNLASMYNLANYNTQAGEVAGTPGFGSVLANLHGQVAPDVIAQLQQGAAERGIVSGQQFGDSPNTNSAYMRALGLNSQGQQLLGQQQYGNLLGHFPMAAPFNMSSMFVSPEEQQAANAAANVSAAAPNPKQAADEEFRKLLEAIAAGKGSIPTTIPGGVPGVTLPTPTGGTGSGPSGTMVGGALNTGGRGPNPNLWVPNSPNRFNPTPGRPPDATQAAAQGGSWNLGGTSPNSSSFLNNTVFGQPGYENYGILGMGLDPTLNAMFGTAPSDTSGFGSPITAPDLWAGSGSDLWAGSGSGAPFGTPITSPDLWDNYTGYNWWEDPEFSLPYETPGISQSDRNQFGQPISAGDWWNSPAPMDTLFGNSNQGLPGLYEPPYGDLNDYALPYEDWGSDYFGGD